MSDHFITKTSLAQADLVTIDGQAVVKADSVLRDAIAGSDTPELGTFFATPVLGAAAADGAQSVSWYAAVAGKPKSLDLLDGAAREDVSERLAQRMAEIETLKMRRPDLANTLSAAQSVLSRGDILVIAGQPVAINWGARPHQVDPESHYNATIGYFLSGGGNVLAPVAAPKPVLTSAAPAAAAAAAPVAAITSEQSNTADSPRNLWGMIIPLALLATILLGVLIWLAWPGTRLFPPEIPTLATEMDTRTSDTLRDHNIDLQARADALQDALDNGQCTDEGLFVLPDGRTPEGLLPPNPDQPQDDAGSPDISPDPLLPPNPNRVQMPDGTDTVEHTGNIVDLIERNSVLVVTENGIGTGFFIAPDVVFTNHHVIEEAIGTGRVLTFADQTREFRGTVSQQNPRWTESFVYDE